MPTRTERSHVRPSPHLVGANIDIFIGNVRLRGDFPDALAAQLGERKRQSQEAEEDLPTSWRFAGEVHFIKPHGARLHLDPARVGRARQPVRRL
jgi:hypothetical protein